MLDPDKPFSGGAGESRTRDTWFRNCAVSPYPLCFQSLSFSPVSPLSPPFAGRVCNAICNVFLLLFLLCPLARAQEPSSKPSSPGPKFAPNDADCFHDCLRKIDRQTHFNRKVFVSGVALLAASQTADAINTPAPRFAGAGSLTRSRAAIRRLPSKLG